VLKQKWLIGRIKVIEGYHLNQNSHFIFVKDTFKAQNKFMVAFEFLNKNKEFKITSHSKIGNYRLENYFHIPTKVKENGDFDQDFIVKLKDEFDTNPIKSDEVHLLCNELKE